MWYLKCFTSGVIPTYMVVSIKMQDSSINHLPIVQPFVSKEAGIPFMEIDDKGGEVVQRYAIILGSMDLDKGHDLEGEQH
jgi:hypothetical protein